MNTSASLCSCPREVPLAFVSKICSYKSGANTNHSGSFKKGHKVPEKWKEGIIKNLEKARESIRGKTYKELGKIPYIRSPETRQKNRMTTKNRWLRYWEKHGRKVHRKHKHLMDAKYYNWRKKVFERDNHTCQKCGLVGGKLIAHHIEGWVNCEKKRFWVRNGATLCVSHHIRFHKMFGRKNNTRKQLQDYYKSRHSQCVNQDKYLEI